MPCASERMPCASERMACASERALIVCVCDKCVPQLGRVEACPLCVGAFVPAVKVQPPAMRMGNRAKESYLLSKKWKENTFSFMISMSTRNCRYLHPVRHGSGSPWDQFIEHSDWCQCGGVILSRKLSSLFGVVCTSSQVQSTCPNMYASLV